LRQFLPQHALTLLAHESGFGIAIVAQQGVQAGLVEFAIGAEKGAVGADELGDFGVGNGEAEFFGLLVDGGAGHQPGQHLAVEPGLAGLVIGDGAAGLALHALQFVLIFHAIVADADFRIADHGDLVAAEIAEHVANAPEAKADDDQSRKRREKQTSENVLGHDPQAVEHGLSLKG
jgi:hypothetical protein